MNYRNELRMQLIFMGEVFCQVGVLTLQGLGEALGMTMLGGENEKDGV